MSNSRKPQRIARELARSQSIPYQQALKLVLATLPEAECESLLTYIDDAYMPPSGLFVLGADDTGIVGYRAADLNRHLVLCGEGGEHALLWAALGTAQSTDYPIIALDRDGQLADRYLEALLTHCPSRAGDVVLCDFSDDEVRPAINPLDISSLEEIEAVVGTVLEMLHIRSSAPRAAHLTGMALTALMEANLYIQDPGTKNTLLELTRFFTDIEFRRLTMEFCSFVNARHMFDPEDGPFELLSERQQTEYIMPIIRAMSPFGIHQRLHDTFAVSENAFNLTELIAQRKIVIVKTGGRAGQAAVDQLLYRFVIASLLANMDRSGRGRDSQAGKSGGGCRVFVADGDGLLAKHEALPEARKWDLGVMLACRRMELPDRATDEVFDGFGSVMVARQHSGKEAQLLVDRLDIDRQTVVPSDLMSLADDAWWANLLVPRDGRLTPAGPVKLRTMELSRASDPAALASTEGAVRARSHALTGAVAPRFMFGADKASRMRLDHIKGALQQMLIQRSDDDMRAQGIEPSSWDAQTGWSDSWQ